MARGARRAATRAAAAESRTEADALHNGHHAEVAEKPDDAAEHGKGLKLRAHGVRAVARRQRADADLVHQPREKNGRGQEKIEVDTIPHWKRLGHDEIAAEEEHGHRGHAVADDEAGHFVARKGSCPRTIQCAHAKRRRAHEASRTHASCNRRNMHTKLDAHARRQPGLCCPDAAVKRAIFFCGCHFQQVFIIF